MFDIDAEISDNRGSFEMKQKCLTEESKGSKSFRKHESFQPDKISRIEDIEKIAHLFKFKDNIKEIKVKPKENANLNNIDFTSLFNKVLKVVLYRL